ncbi:hypothetical protein F4808DRAFT_128252 [Astrocystis sublimbata]|nr:hypothetical protein F4808DRAFT_128252 [Astrocystis sublimbata]
MKPTVIRTCPTYPSPFSLAHSCQTAGNPGHPVPVDYLDLMKQIQGENRLLNIVLLGRMVRSVPVHLSGSLGLLFGADRQSSPGTCLVSTPIHGCVLVGRGRPGPQVPTYTEVRYPCTLVSFRSVGLKHQTPPFISLLPALSSILHSHVRLSCRST